MRSLVTIDCVVFVVGQSMSNGELDSIARNGPLLHRQIMSYITKSVLKATAFAPSGEADVHEIINNTLH